MVCGRFTAFGSYVSRAPAHHTAWPRLLAGACLDASLLLTEKSLALLGSAREFFAMFQDVERRAAVSAGEFFFRYVLARRPVILTDALKGARAVTNWDHAFFVDKYGDERFNVLHYVHQSGEKETVIREHTLREYFALLANPASWADPKRAPYLEGYGIFNRFPELEEDVTPLSFYPNWFRRLPPRLSYTLYGWRNLLVSPAGAVYNLHVDQLAVHACILQFSGRKRFVMYPGEEAENLYHGKVDPDAPDYDRFPLFKNAKGRLEAILHPGEVCFIPHYYWHQVTTLDPSVSVVEHAVNSINLPQHLWARYQAWRAR